MTLRARLLLLTSLLIATCVLLVSGVLGYVTWRSLVARVTDEAVLASTLLGQIAAISEQAPQEVETMVGDSLTTDAYLLAQLIDVAKRSKVQADDLTRRLRDIAARSDIDEIWVADGVGDPVASSFDEVDASIIDDDPIIMQTINKVRTGNAFATVTGALTRGTDGVRMKYAGVGQLDGTGAVLAGRNFAKIEELSARLGLKKTLDVILAGRNVEGVWITDEKLSVIASAAPGDVTPLLHLAELAMSRAGPVTSLADGRLVAAAPILDQDGIPGGAAIVSLPTAELRQAIRAFLLYGGGITAVALALGFLLASLVARHVSGPIATVIGAAQDVEQRRFVPASLDRVAGGADELGHLARVFRTMAIQVMDREAELERLVQARTGELVAKNDALESAQKQMEEELEAAQSLQAAILPQHFEPLPTHAVSAYMMPAKHMGGDFYDAFRIDEHRYGFAIADVAGKGVLAAFFMAVSRNVLRTYGLEGLPPGECLLRANTELCRTNPMELFVTVFYAVLDTRTGEFAYANGGHPDVFLVHGASRSQAAGGDRPTTQAVVDRLPRTGGMALGMFDDVPYAEGTVQLSAGDTLFLMTDGISEAMNMKGELFGEEPVVLELSRNTGQSLPELIEHVVGVVHGFVDGAPPSDDITCLALRYIGTGA